jgi:ATP-dependent Clp protease protease subunit
MNTINKKRKLNNNNFFPCNTNENTKKRVTEILRILDNEEKENIITNHKPVDDLKDSIYRKNNHIYFTTSVSKRSINKLLKLISAVNNDYQMIMSNIGIFVNIDESKGLDIKPIYLHINSNGGELHEGFRAMDIIKNSAIPIHTIIEGVAVSAASMIYLAGGKRYMTERSQFLMHQMSGGQIGTYEELKDGFVNNTVHMEQIIDIYHQESSKKMKKKDIREILKRDIFWNYETCKSYNLVDDLYTGQF